MLRLCALVVVAALPSACATTRGGPQALASIDVVDDEGRLGTLAEHAGRVVVLDVCASWAEACHLNARVVDEAAAELADTDAVLVTLLLDDLPPDALRAYVAAAGRVARVAFAGPRTREGRSVLGDVAGVPRVVFFGRDGKIVVDESGGVLSTAGVVRRVRALL